MKRGDIVTNNARTWFGIYSGEDRYWLCSIDPDNKLRIHEHKYQGSYTSVCETTPQEKAYFKKCIAKHGYSYQNGELINEF